MKVEREREREREREEGAKVELVLTTYRMQTWEGVGWVDMRWMRRVFCLFSLTYFICIVYTLITTSLIAPFSLVLQTCTALDLSTCSSWWLGIEIEGSFHWIFLLSFFHCHPLQTFGGGVGSNWNLEFPSWAGFS